MILVTGANGLVGSAVCMELLKRQQPFRAMVRKKSNLDLIRGISEDQLCYSDVLDEPSLKESLLDVEVIIHCAAVISYDPRERERMYEVNVLGTRNIVNYAIDAGVKKIIHLSSVSAIARNRGDDIVDGRVKWPGSEKTSYYGETKFLAELELFRGSTEGLEVICLNPSIILGPGDPEKSSTQLFKYVWDEKPFYTDGHVNFVDLRDLVNIIMAGIGMRGSEDRYIINGVNMPYIELFREIADRFGKKAPGRRASPFMIGITIALEKLRSRLTGSSPLITRETARSSMSDTRYDVQLTRETFNIDFRPAKETLDWVCNNLIVESKNNSIK